VDVERHRVVRLGANVKRASRRGVIKIGTPPARFVLVSFRLKEMTFAYSESARLVRSALGAVLRRRREATRRTLTEVAGEAGLSPAHLSEVERGRKEVSTERLLAVAHALGARPADIYADLARLLGADADQRTWPEDPPVKLRLATASLPLEALRSVADFSAYLAMANPPPRPKPPIGFDTRR
jgi:transcriptional regulator with XRE-family HTH domain